MLKMTPHITISLYNLHAVYEKNSNPVVHFTDIQYNKSQ